MSFAVENKERLPEFPPGDEHTQYRLNQLVQILERRFGGVEESLERIDVLNIGAGAASGDYAPLVHTHGESEITDLGSGSYYVDPAYISDTMQLSDINNVNASGATNNQVLTYNASAAEWQAQTPAGGGGAGFSPTIVDAEDQDILVYNASQNRWENVNPYYLPYSGGYMTGFVDMQENWLGFQSSFNRIQWESVTDKWRFASTRNIEIYANNISFVSTDSPALYSWSDGTNQLDLSFVTNNARWQYNTAGQNIEWYGRNSGDTLDHVMMEADPDGSVTLYYNNVAHFRTNNEGIEIADTTGQDDPGITFYDAGFSALQGTIRFNNTVLSIDGNVNGQDFRFQSKNAIGTTTNLFYANPDQESELFYAGEEVLRTTATGIDVRATAGFNPVVRLETDAGTDRGTLDATTTQFRLDAKVNSMDVLIRSFDALGATIDLFTGDPDAGVTLYYQDDPVFATTATGFNLNPTTANATIMMQEGAADRYSMFYDLTNDWAEHRTWQNSDEWRLYGTNSVGTKVPMIFADPDGRVTLHFNNAISVKTRDTGIDFTGSLNNVEGGNVNTYLNFETSVETDRAFFGFIDGQPNFELRNLNHGGNCDITGEDTGGVLRDIMLADPDADVKLHYAGTERLSTTNTGATITGTTAELNNSAAATAATLTVRNSEGSYILQADGDVATFILADSDGTSNQETAWDATGDGAFQAYHDNDAKVRTAADADGGAELNQGNNWEPVHAGGLFVKGSDTTRTNNTITDDPDLTYSVPTNTNFSVELFLEIENASATPDFQFQFTVPTSATFDGLADHVDQDNTNNGVIGVNDATAETIQLQAAEPKYVRISGVLAVAGTSGTFALGWAQATTDGLNGTTLRANSWMKLTELP